MKQRMLLGIMIGGKDEFSTKYRSTVNAQKKIKVGFGSYPVDQRKWPN